MANNEELNRILAKIVLALFIIIIDMGAIVLIADGETDGFGTAVCIIVAIFATIGLGKAFIER